METEDLAALAIAFQQTEQELRRIQCTYTHLLAKCEDKTLYLCLTAHVPKDVAQIVLEYIPGILRNCGTVFLTMLQEVANPQINPPCVTLQPQEKQAFVGFDKNSNKNEGVILACGLQTAVVVAACIQHEEIFVRTLNCVVQIYGAHNAVRLIPIIIKHFPLVEEIPINIQKHFLPVFTAINVKRRRVKRFRA
jgi:hypothetical protein